MFVKTALEKLHADREIKRRYFQVFQKFQKNFLNEIIIILINYFLEILINYFNASKGPIQLKLSIRRKDLRGNVILLKFINVQFCVENLSLNVENVTNPLATLANANFSSDISCQYFSRRTVSTAAFRQPRNRMSAARYPSKKLKVIFYRNIF